MLTTGAPQRENWQPHERVVRGGWDAAQPLQWDLGAYSTHDFRGLSNLWPIEVGHEPS